MSSDELVFLKLGGSLVTDKTGEQALRGDVLRRLAREIAAALAAAPELRLLVGHGSGSFGHTAAARYGTRNGVRSAADWAGYATTAVAAARLNRFVVEALDDAGVPALPVQPSASAWCEGGELCSLDVRPISAGLRWGLVPVVYGDVALDGTLGGTIISTEQILSWLAKPFAPRRIILAGEVPGVMAVDPAADPNAPLIAAITPGNFAEIAAALGGARGADVTGGMAGKVATMLALLQASPALDRVQILSGMEPGCVQRALIDRNSSEGTVIRLRA